jgi:ABC-2 type transport system ATP-binding protein
MTQTTLAPPPVEPAPEDGAVVAVRDVRRSYGDRPVLVDLSFHVLRGEIFGILGANGAGKTTAVEILQGLRRRDAGDVRVLDLDPARDQPRLRALVGTQLQSSALPDRLQVGEALRLFARIAGDVVDWRELMAEWDLLRLERTAYRDLSGGEQQRLFLALALVNRPRLVFLDELTQGLDPTARRETWSLVERVRDAGTTVVLVSHYMDEVERLCDRVGVVRDGRMSVVGRPTELVSAHGGDVRCRFTVTTTTGLGAALAALPGVREVAARGPAYVVSGQPDSPVRVAAELDRRGLAPTDFTVLRPSLEDVFVALTGGDR